MGTQVQKLQSASIAPPGGNPLSLDTRDFDELAGAFRRWRHEFQQLSGGSFSGSLRLAQTGGAQLLRVSFNRVIQARGTQPTGSYTFAPAMPTNMAARCRGQHLQPGRIIVLSPGQEMDHRTPERYSSIVLSIDAELLHRMTTSLGGACPEALLAGKVTVQSDPVVTAAFSAYLHDLLDLMTTRPDLTTQPGACREIEEECVRRLVHTVGLVEELTPVEAQSVSRREVVRRAEDLMLAHLAEPLTIADLCDEAGVSERTLHYAFLDIHGVSPKAYLKAKRLNRVRQDLKSADPSRDSVAAIAVRWGFWHTGHFAADYRRLFGELPSETFESGTSRRRKWQGSCAST